MRSESKCSAVLKTVSFGNNRTIITFQQIQHNHDKKYLKYIIQRQILSIGVKKKAT